MPNIIIPSAQKNIKNQIIQPIKIQYAGQPNGREWFSLLFSTYTPPDYFKQQFWTDFQTDKMTLDLNLNHSLHPISLIIQSIIKLKTLKNNFYLYKINCYTPLWTLFFHQNYRLYNFYTPQKLIYHLIKHFNQNYIIQSESEPSKITNKIKQINQITQHHITQFDFLLMLCRDYNIHLKPTIYSKFLTNHNQSNQTNHTIQLKQNRFHTPEINFNFNLKSNSNFQPIIEQSEYKNYPCLYSSSQKAYYQLSGSGVVFTKLNYDLDLDKYCAEDTRWELNTSQTNQNFNSIQFYTRLLKSNQSNQSNLNATYPYWRNLNIFTGIIQGAKIKSIDQNGHYLINYPEYYQILSTQPSSPLNGLEQIRKNHFLHSPDHTHHQPLLPHTEVSLICNAFDSQYPIILGATNHTQHIANTHVQTAQNVYHQNQKQHGFGFINQGPFKNKNFNSNLKNSRQNAIVFYNPADKFQHKPFHRFKLGDTVLNQNSRHFLKDQVGITHEHMGTVSHSHSGKFIYLIGEKKLNQNNKFKTQIRQALNPDLNHNIKNNIKKNNLKFNILKTFDLHYFIKDIKISNSSSQINFIHNTQSIYNLSKSPKITQNYYSDYLSYNWLPYQKINKGQKYSAYFYSKKNVYISKKFDLNYTAQNLKKIFYQNISEKNYFKNTQIFIQNKKSIFKKYNLKIKSKNLNAQTQLISSNKININSHLSIQNSQNITIQSDHQMWVGGLSFWV